MKTNNTKHPIPKPNHSDKVLLTCFNITNAYWPNNFKYVTIRPGINEKSNSEKCIFPDPVLPAAYNSTMKKLKTTPVIIGLLKWNCLHFVTEFNKKGNNKNRPTSRVCESKQNKESQPKVEELSFTERKVVRLGRNLWASGRPVDGAVWCNVFHAIHFFFKALTRMIYVIGSEA